MIALGVALLVLCFAALLLLNVPVAFAVGIAADILATVLPRGSAVEDRAKRNEVVVHELE